MNLIFKAYKKTNIFFLYLKMTKTYFRKYKERIQKEAREKY